MNRKPVSLLLCALFLALLSLALSPNVHAATDSSVSAKIYTLDLGARTVTLKKADNSTLTLKFLKTTQIQRNGKNARLSKLLLNDRVNAQYKKNLTLTQFAATGPKSRKIGGALSNAVKGSGTVTVNGRTLQTTTSTRIARNGKLVSLSELTRRDSVVAHINKTGAKSAQASSKARVLDLLADGPQEGEVHGLISAISGGQVTVTPDNGTADVVLNVTADTLIEVDGKTAALTDLAAGMKVEAAYDPATNNAYSIEADSHGETNDAKIDGTVSAVDAAGGTLTVTPKTGSPVTLLANASTEIRVNDQAATLADVQVGMPVEADYDSASMIASEIKAGAGDDNQDDENIEGTVAAVEAGAQTVTVTPQGGGADLTLNVTTETEIEVNGEEAGIGDIAVDQSIRAEYDPATNNAFEIKVGSEDGGGGDERQIR